MARMPKSSIFSNCCSHPAITIDKVFLRFSLFYYRKITVYQTSYTLYVFRLKDFIRVKDCDRYEIMLGQIDCASLASIQTFWDHLVLTDISFGTKSATVSFPACHIWRPKLESNPACGSVVQSLPHSLLGVFLLRLN